MVPSLLLATDNATLSTWRSLCPSGASFMPDHMLTVIGAQSQSLCFNMDLAFGCIPVYKDDCVTIVRVIVNSSVFCPDLAHYYITVLLLHFQKLLIIKQMKLIVDGYLSGFQVFSLSY